MVEKVSIVFKISDLIIAMGYSGGTNIGNYELVS